MQETEKKLILLKGLEDTIREGSPSLTLKNILKTYNLKRGQSPDVEDYHYHRWLSPLRKMKRKGLIRKPELGGGWHVTESGLEFLEKKK